MHCHASRDLKLSENEMMSLKVRAEIQLMVPEQVQQDSISTAIFQVSECAGVGQRLVTWHGIMCVLLALKMSLYS